VDAVGEELSPLEDNWPKLLKPIPFGLNCPNKRTGVDVFTLLNSDGELSFSVLSLFVLTISAKVNKIIN
jgi:hypothetical protein